MASFGTVYLILLLVSIVVCGFMLYLAAVHRRRRGARTFGLLVVVLIVWSLAQVAGVVASSPETARIAVQAKFVALPFVPVAVLLLALQYTDREQYVSPTSVMLLCLLPATTVGLALSNPVHEFVWTGVGMVALPPYAVYEVSYRSWYWVHIAYSHTLIAAGSYLFVRWALTAEGAYRRQANYILVGIAVPWTANLLELVGLWNTVVDPGPMFFTISGLCIGIAVFRFRFLDLVPVARDTAFTVLREGVLVLDDRGRVLSANPAARELLDSTAELVGSDIDAVAPPALADACRSADEPGTLSLSIDGAERFFDVRRSLLPEGGRVVLLYDSTERRRQARRLERQNESLERFTSVLSHDIRNPLNVAEGYVELLATDAEGETEEHAERAMDAMNRMEELVDDTLTLAREGSAVNDPEPVDLDRVAHEAWRNVETGGADLSVATELTVQADANRVTRLFENLFRNSVEHGSTGSGAEPGDSVEHGSSDGDGEPSTALSVRVERTESGFAVTDDGPGIPDDERESVLEPGYSTSDDGTGLGLVIVEEIAHAHGWELDVETSETGGARFAFRLAERSEGKRLNQFRTQSHV